MRTLQIQDVNLAFGEREILKNIGFTMAERTRAALAGANGSGKSTLLKVISGAMKADSMTLSITKGARISYLPQSDIVLPEKSVYNAAEEGYSRFEPILEEIRSLEEKTSLGGKEALSAAIEAAGQSPNVRGERLSTADFVRLADALHTAMQQNSVAPGT